MPSLKVAAARLRYGTLCTLASLALLSSPHASATMSLVITGTPPTSASVGKLYSFQPAARDLAGRKMTFKIWNKPSWASFDTSTGRLYGTPAAGNVGTYHWVQIEVLDGISHRWLPAYTLTVSPAAAAGARPVISGTPPATAIVGHLYSFQPVARDPGGLPMTFQIWNKPSWASFSTTTGRLYGTPTASNIGTYHWVQIEVLDGVYHSWLPAYTLTVSGATSTPPPSGSVTINWTPPTENMDGSTLTNLSGYHIYYGTSQASLTHVVNITNPGLASYVVSDLAAATYYFAVTSVNSNGTESPRSAVVSAVVQ
ncbi:MAG TPA: putative Ig domain-containing protein [Steroidobacteraceae bacterium]|nr:putative Ig domain-containing protein [Steroidobacteraceae bacterium]